MQHSITNQVAALPYRVDDDGNIEVMLVTSRSGDDHWIPPKGHPVLGKKPYETAAQEAYEEAGIIGVVSSRSLGNYRAIKIRADGTETQLEVNLFPMRFVDRAADWPERGQRNTVWLSPADAAKAVREPELANLIAHFQPTQIPG